MRCRESGFNTCQAAQDSPEQSLVWCLVRLPQSLKRQIIEHPHNIFSVFIKIKKKPKKNKHILSEVTFFLKYHGLFLDLLFLCFLNWQGLFLVPWEALLWFLPAFLFAVLQQLCISWVVKALHKTFLEENGKRRRERKQSRKRMDLPDVYKETLKNIF